MMIIIAQTRAHIQSKERSTRFDTDANYVGVDNRCSACISDSTSDFVSPLRETDRVIKGFNGSKTTKVKTGTIQWCWEDDEGQKHTVTIPNSLYVKDCGVRLLSPQLLRRKQFNSRQLDE